jgi:peroxidase
LAAKDMSALENVQHVPQFSNFSTNAQTLRFVPLFATRRTSNAIPLNVTGLENLNLQSLRRKTPRGMKWRCTTVLACYMFLNALASERKARQVQFADFPQEEIGGGACTTSTGETGRCTELTRCVTLELDIVRLARSTCALRGQEFGVCCPNSLSPDSRGAVPVGPVNIPRPAQGTLSTVSNEDLNRAAVAAQQSLRQRDILEGNLLGNGIFTPQNSPEEDHQLIVFTFPFASSLGRQAFITSQVSEDISNRLNLQNRQKIFDLPKVNIANSDLASLCPKEPVCPANKYRKIDGSCNNVQNKDWGKSFRAFARMLPPKYGDGLKTPRVASDGSELPSARVVSQTVIRGGGSEYPHISLMTMAWGQFLDHDITQTPIHRGANNSGIACCSRRILANPELRHPECLQIGIPENDAFFAQFRQSCMEFVRSLGAPRTDCTLGPREQMNQLTAFIDASQIYGSSDENAKTLRTNVGGKLTAASAASGKDLPPHQDGVGCKGNVNLGQFCFKAGDTRVNEQPQLTSLHVIWLREHNRIADELARINPGWNDETLYQEARRIVAAMMQHITYNEFLPIVLGRRVMRAFGILLSNSGFTNNYDPKLDPTIFNEFATAAYRFGHSTVPGIIQLRNGGQVGTQRLRDHFLKPYEASLLDGYLRGGVEQSSLVVDNALTEEITTQLFKRTNSSFGLDLAALNIQRGRDHGLPSYNDYREFCRLPKASSFNDVAQLTNPQAARSMSSVYRNVDDIDLWIGGVSEKNLPGAIVGPTLACILAEQFRRLRNGDRFWYERGNAESAFSEAQLAEIRKSSLARVICDNSDSVTTMQPLAFFKPDTWNPQVECSSKSIPTMSLQPWQNEPVK